MFDASISATETDDGVRLALRIENRGSDAAAFEFRTGQRAEFVAYPTGDGSGAAEGAEPTAGAEPADSADPADAGEPVWRYGATRAFTQALGTETLAPGEAVTREATWRDPPPGTYRIVGETAAANRDAGAATLVTVV